MVATSRRSRSYMNSNRPVSMDHSNHSGCALQNDAEEVLRTEIPLQSVGCTSSIGTALAVLPWLGQRDRQRLACLHCSYTHRPHSNWAWRWDRGRNPHTAICSQPHNSLRTLNSVLSSAPPIPAGIRSFQWNSSGIHRNSTGIHRNSTGIRMESSRLRLKYSFI